MSANDTLLENVFLLILHVDRDGVILDFLTSGNDNFLTSSKNIKGRSVFDLREKVGNRNNLKACIEGQKTQIIEFKFELNGRIKNYRSIFNPKNSNEAVIVVEDISEIFSARIKEKEERDKRFQILEQTIDAVISIDEKKKITFFNPSAETLFGFRKEEVLGKNVKVIVPSTHKEQHDKYINRNINTGENKVIGTSRDLIMTRKDGSSFYGNLSLSKVSVGDSYQYTAFIKDVTEKVLASKVDLLEVETLKLAMTTNSLIKVLNYICSNCNQIFLESYSWAYLLNEKNEIISESSRIPKNLSKKLYDNLNKFHIDNHEPILYNKIQSDNEWKGIQGELKRIGFKSCWLVPVFSNEHQLIGKVFMFYKDCKQQCQYEIHFLERLSRVLAIVCSKLYNRQKLRDREEKYRELVTNQPMGMLIHVDGVIKFINPAGCKIIGDKSTNIIEKHIFDYIMPDMHADVQSRINKLKQGEEIPQKVDRIKDAQGLIKYVSVVVSETDFNGDHATLVQMYDVTEKVKLEFELENSNKRFELAVKGSGAGLWDWYDIEGGGLWWAPKTYELLGYEPYEFEVSIDVLKELLHKDDHEKLFTLLEKHLAGEAEYSLEYRLRTKSGHYKWLLVNGQAQWDNDGTPTRMVGNIIDIDQQKISEQRFELAVKGSGAGLWDWYDIEGGGLWWAPKTYELLGYEPYEFEVSIDVLKELLHKDDHEKLFTLLEKHLAGEAEYSLEYRLRTKSGHYKWLLVNGQAQWDNDGTPTRMVGNIIDIDQQKISEQRFELAVKGSGAGLWDLYDVKNGKMWWAPKTYELLGYSSDDLEVSLEKFEELMHPEDRGYILNMMSCHLKGDGICSGEYRLKTKSGTYKWFNCNGQAQWDNDGNPTRMVGNIIDIDSRKRSEENFQLAIEGSGGGIWEWVDISTDVVNWAPKVFTLLGYEPEEFVPSLVKFASLIHPEDADLFKIKLDSHLKQNKPFEIEYRLKTKEGEFKWFLGNGQAIWDENGNPLRMVGTIIDIDKRKTLENVVQRRNLFSNILLESEVISSTINNESEWLISYCKLLVQNLDYGFVWIGERSDIYRANNVSYYTNSEVKIEELFSAEKYGPSKKAISTLQLNLISSIKESNMNAKWKKEMLRNGFITCFSMPYIEENHITGTINVYSKTHLDLDNAYKGFLNQLAYNIGSHRRAIRLKQRSEELHSYNQLVIDSLQVVSASIDMIHSKISIIGDVNNLIGYNDQMAMSVLMNFTSYLHPNDTIHVSNSINASKENYGKYDIEFRIKKSDGKYVWLNSIGTTYWKKTKLIKLVGIFVNIEERKMAEMNLLKAQYLGRDNERRRMAKDLHDGLVQTLNVATMTLGNLRNDIQTLSEEKQQLFLEAKDLIVTAIQDTRSIAYDMVPQGLIDFGLTHFITTEIRILNENYENLKAIFYHDDIKQRFKGEIELNCYNIIKEIINNTVKHAEATIFEIELNRKDDELFFKIRDNGKGFDPDLIKNSNTMGLKNIMSRVAGLNGDIIIDPKRGTCYEITIPLLDE